MAFSLNLTMKKSWIFFAAAIASSILTYTFYDPVSAAIYKFSEPDFRCPIKLESGRLVIRNDSHGDGDFGAKRRNGRFHSGIDIVAPVGTPVYAARSGIAFCGNVPTGYGKYVMIYHPDGTQSYYGHLSAWCVASTTKVHRGDIIGFVGKTGNASSREMEPHLHFEIRRDGEPQDPQGLMK